MRARALWVLALTMFVGVGSIGCGGGDDDDSAGKGGDKVSTKGDGGTATGSRRCTDEDGDGFGRYCVAGADCDDSDPMVTDECRRCLTTSEGCPCEPGTKPMYCDPEDVRTTMDGKTGVLVCSEGTRYCRDEVWSGCEILFQYATFIPDK
jgi:hypothetical protein